MRKASTRMPEQGTQTPSPAPDLIPAETENQPRTHIAIWHSKRGHFTTKFFISVAYDEKPAIFLMCELARSAHRTYTARG